MLHVEIQSAEGLVVFGLLLCGRFTNTTKIGLLMKYLRIRIENNLFISLTHLQCEIGFIKKGSKVVFIVASDITRSRHERSGWRQ